MIKVLVSGYLGRMGSEVVRLVAETDDLTLVGGFEPATDDEYVVFKGESIAPAFNDLNVALKSAQPDVVVDFSIPKAVANNIRTCISSNTDIVVGTTGLTPDQLSTIEQEIPEDTAVFVAPNFTTGAVLMMALSKIAARFFEDAEVLEFHHNRKVDAPSGTALTTARSIAAARANAGLVSTAPGKETESSGNDGARGALVVDVPVHSIRSNGFVASQEVIFGSPGQVLSIRHDSIERSSYMPGVLLAIRSVASGKYQGLTVGLEKLMEMELSRTITME